MIKNNPTYFLSSKQELPDVSKLTNEECAADFLVRRQTRKRYPGACSLEFQNVMDIIIKSLLKWDTENQKSTGKGMAGDLNGWVQAAEEQGRGTLHAHWQLFTKQLSTKARTDLFHNDSCIRDNARKELADYIDSMICASYGSSIKISHTCNVHQSSNNQSTLNVLDIRAKNDAPDDAKFIQRDTQIFRDARHKEHSGPLNGELIICRGSVMVLFSQVTLLIIS